MPLNPASLIFALQEWVEKKILGHLQPLRVDYDDSFLKIELLPWAHMTAILAGFLVLMVVVSLASGSWTGLIVALFFGALPALLLTLALRKIRTIIIANKSQQSIRVTRRGVFGENSKLTSVKNLKSVTYEPVGMTRTYDISVMTGEGSTNLLENEGEDEAAEIIGYLNAFFFSGEETEGEDIT